MHLFLVRNIFNKNLRLRLRGLISGSIEKSQDNWNKRKEKINILFLKMCKIFKTQFSFE